LSESYDIQTHFFPCCFFATGDSLYLSGTEFDLQPLASEYYGDRAGTNYYSVALVPAAFCASNPAPTLASLKVSCCCCCYPPPPSPLPPPPQNCTGACTSLVLKAQTLQLCPESLLCHPEVAAQACEALPFQDQPC
jgi:hypothetical protein